MYYLYRFLTALVLICSFAFKAHGQGCDETFTPTASELNPPEYADFLFEATFSEGDRTFLPSYKHFTEAEEITKGRGSQPVVQAVADFNLDGLEDLLIAFHETRQKGLLLLSTGNGDFREKWLPEASKSRLLREVSIGDFDHDGRPDIYGHTAPHDWTHELRSGKPSGSFPESYGRDEPDFLLLNKASGFVVVEDISVLTNANNHQGAVADLNNDGFLDVVSLDQKENEGSDEFILYGYEQNKFKRGRPLPRMIAEMQYMDVEAGDLNGDGLVDLVFTQNIPQANIMSPGEVIILMNSVAGIELGEIKRVGKFLDKPERWRAVLAYHECLATNEGFGKSYGPRPGTGEITLEDFDQDGDLDIFYTQHIGGGFSKKTSKDKGTNIKVLRNDYPQFVDVTPTVIPHQEMLKIFTREFGFGRPLAIHFMDLDLDGTEDLLLSNYNTHYHQIEGIEANAFIYLKRGEAFLPVKRKTLGSLEWRKHHTPIDLNGDGLKDLASFRYDRKKSEKMVVDTYIANPWMQKNVSQAVDPKSYDPFAEQPADLKSKLACEDPVFASMMGDKCKG